MRVAIAAVAAAIVLFAGFNVASVEPISPQHGTSTPATAAPPPSTKDDCDPEAYPEWTEVDYRASGKSSPVSLVPQYRIDSAEDFNRVFHTVMCGGRLGSLLRGPTRLVAEGVLMTLNGGKMHHFSSDEEWHRVVRQIMAGWQPDSTWFYGQRDTPGVTKTVYAERHEGELVLRVDTLDHGRTSNYASTTFLFRGEKWRIKINVACFQVTNISTGAWRILQH